MLVLSRKIGERLVIGEDIVVTILETHGQRVRLGIEAPARVRVVREELETEKPISTAVSVPRRK